MSKIKKNVIKINPLAYNIGLIAVSGIGKTTLAKEVCEKLAGEEGYVIANCGLEDGIDAIPDAMYTDIPDYDAFEEFVDDVIENRKTTYRDLKVIVWDTLDELFRITEPAVIKMHNRENPSKITKSIKAAFGGYMAGEDKAIELILEKLWKLKKIGINMFVIGHTKKRTKTDPVTGEEYDILTTNMSNRYFDAIQKKLHILGVGNIDREIVQEKTGKQVKIGQVVKAEIKGRIQSEARTITFRDDNFSIDSKSRFKNITNSISFNADEFINAITDAIKLAHEEQQNKKALNVAMKEQEEQKEAMIEDTSETVLLDELKAKIKEYLSENIKNKANIVPLIEKSKELGYNNPLEVKTTNEAKQILDIIK